MPRRFVILLLPTLLLGACADISSNPSTGGSSASERQALPQSSSPVAQNYHAVSIPALRTKQYDGRDLKLGAVQSRNASYTRYTITYKSGDLTISGILNIPVGDGPFPVLLLNHGFIEPSVYTNGRGLKREQDYFARNGYAVLHSDYRNHAFSGADPENDVKLRFGYVEDVINAIQAIRSSGIPQLDGERIGMVGHSMGGGVTLNILVSQPGLVDAAVLYAPVSGDARRNYDRWLTRRPLVAKRIDELYGDPQENPQFWHEVSAQSYLSDIQAPVMLFHGDNDQDVPVEWSRELYADLQDLNKQSVYEEYRNEGHEFGPRWTDFMQQSKAFFDAEI